MSADRWQDDAACRDQDPDLFFPTGHGDGSQKYIRARAICDGCPVIAECLDFVMTTESSFGRHGMWAGLTPRERQKRPTIRFCEVCGARFTGYRTIKTCSPKCARSHRNQRQTAYVRRAS